MALSQTNGASQTSVQDNDEFNDDNSTYAEAASCRSDDITIPTSNCSVKPPLDIRCLHEYATTKDAVLSHVPRDDTAAVSAILKRIWSLNRGDNNIEAAIVSLLGIYPVPKAVVESIVAFFLSHEGFVEPDDDFSLQYSDSTKSKELSSLDGESIETETPILNPVTATPHEPANDDPNGDEANNASDLITGNQLLPDGTGEPVTTDPMNLNVDVAATGPSDKPTPLDTKQHSTDSTTHQLNNQITQSATSTSDAEVSGDDDGKKNCCCTIA